LFISRNHLGDMDRHGDVLDTFDVIRLLRHRAWQEPAPSGFTLERAVDALLSNDRNRGRQWIRSIDAGPDAVALRLTDGSRFEVPRGWSGHITDVRAEGELAERLTYEHRTMASVASDSAVAGRRLCPDAAIEINSAFYRREPHQMRRYTALAVDNLRRHPFAYAAASAYRLVRVFIVLATDDQRTVYRYNGSRVIYRAAMAVSLLYLALFLAGLIVAIRTKRAHWLLVLPIAYIPATLCYVLTNMRYTITVQPFVFVFIAIALVPALERMRPPRSVQRQPTGT